MDKFTSLFQSQPAEQDEESLLGEFNETCKLSYKQRMYGFGICFCVGMLMTLCSVIFITFLNMKAFAVFYSLGNIVSLCSTGFLLGPMRQIKMMFDKTRIVATLIFLISIGLTLGMAIGLKNVPLTLICIIIQFCALFWYCLSYIPYGRSMVTKCCGSAVDNVL